MEKCKIFCEIWEILGKVKNHYFDPKIEFKPQKYYVFMCKTIQGRPEDMP